MSVCGFAQRQQWVDSVVERPLSATAMRPLSARRLATKHSKRCGFYLWRVTVDSQDARLRSRPEAVLPIEILVAGREPDDRLEATPEHALAVERHLRGVHLLIKQWLVRPGNLSQKSTCLTKGALL